jgi:hypothetical protein
MRTSLTSLAAVLVVALASAPARAEEARVRDNLFLLEEAYNQEPGVIQHIQSFQLDPRTREWVYSFTEEWPVPDDRHQLSLTVPALAGDGAGRGLCDLLVNYRLQALGMGGKGALALAPRLSLSLPTGDFRAGHGRGAIGVQLALPASLELGPWLVAHVNAGLGLTPGAREPAGRTFDAVDGWLGAALVWQPLHWLNPLVEVSWTSFADSRDQRTSALVLNPGVRFALDVSDELQIVPGLSAPVRREGGAWSAGALAYLSIEHKVF